MTTEKFREAGYYANLINCDPPLIDRERLLADVQLRETAKEDSANQNHDSEHGTIAARLHNVKNLIQGNIDALDYLRGISSLEKSFSNLIEEVIRTAIVLSEVNGVSHPQHVYDPSMEEKVDRCWTYIRQLTDVVHWHVTQAIRYHKFYHDIKTSQLELDHFVQSSVASLRELETLDLNDLDQLEHVNKAIQEQLEKLTKLASTIRQLSLQARTVAPLQYRHLLPPGRHSAEVLASMRLPSGTWLHRGDPVKTWVSNAMASELHREWQTETLDGNQTATLPSLCLWLTSPTHTPESSLRDAVPSELSTDTKPASSPRQPEVSKTSSAASPRGIPSAKTFAHVLQNDLLNHWMEMVNEFARLLLPVYEKYLVLLTNIEGDIPVTNIEETGVFFEQLKPLTQYGESSGISLLEKLIGRKLHASKQDPAVSERDFRQLSTTLRTWNHLRELLKEAKMAASLRSFDKTALEQSPRSYFEKGVRTFDSRRVVTPFMEYPDLAYGQPFKASYGESSQNEELITSFAEPAPKTFRAAPKSEFRSPGFNEPEGVDMMQHRCSMDRPDRAKRAHSQPAGTHDLMTQVTTPYIPTLINCPRCALPYEIEIYGSEIELTTLGRTQMHDSPSVSSGRLMVCTGDQTPVQSDHSQITPTDARLTGSSPTLSRPADRAASGTRVVEPPIKTKKKRSRFRRHRSHSFNRSTTETTGSSGFGSSPEHPTTITKNGLEKRSVSRKNTKGDGVKKTKAPLFHWGRRTRQKQMDSHNMIPQTENPLIDANREIERSAIQPVLRSRSWAQHGTPWGYGPPLHDQWRATSHYVSPKESYAVRTPRIQSHSEKLLAKASRPKLFGERFNLTGTTERLGTPHPYSTVDSGIQTDTDVTTGQSDAFVFDASPTTFGTRRIESLREKAQLEIRSPQMVDYTMQCSPHDDHTDTWVWRTVKVESGCQSNEESFEQWHASPQMNTWDVCCQIGVLYRSKGISAQVKAKEEPVQRENIRTAEVQAEVEAPIPIQHLKSSDQQQRPQSSVSCQIGSVVVNTGVGSDVIEAVQLLDENIRVYEQREFIREKEGRSEQAEKLLVGKKLQVGSPWWQQHHDTGSKITVSDIGLSPMEELQTPNEERFQKVQEPVHRWTQTLVAHERLDHRPEHVNKFIQVQFVQVDDRKQVKTHGNAYFSGTRQSSTKCADLTSVEQQTLIKLSDPLVSGIHCVSTGSDALRSQLSRNVEVQVFRPSQLSASTQIGQGFSLPTSDGEPLYKVRQKAVDSTDDLFFALKSSPARYDSAPTPITTQLAVDTRLATPEASGATLIQSQCPKCGFLFEPLKQAQTRSKRIQKGLPSFLRSSLPKKHYPQVDGNQSTSETEIVDDSAAELERHAFTDKTTSTRISRAHLTPRRKRHHLVLDIGLCSGKHGSTWQQPSTRRGLSQPAFNCWHDGEERDSFTGSTSSAEYDRFKETFESVRMCFHLSPNSGNNCGGHWTQLPIPRHKSRPALPRSLSVDALPVVGRDSVAHLTDGVCSSYAFEEKREQPTLRRAAYGDRGITGTRRRIDRLRQRPDLY